MVFAFCSCVHCLCLVCDSAINVNAPRYRYSQVVMFNVMCSYRVVWHVSDPGMYIAVAAWTFIPAIDFQLIMNPNIRWSQKSKAFI